MTSTQTPKAQDPHLTAEQFGDLVESGSLGAADSAANAHLAACELCKEELSNMKQALDLFRESTAAFAQREFSRGHQVEISPAVTAHPGFSPRLLWAAAGLLVLAGILPFEFGKHSQPVPQPTKTATRAAASGESDEALLDDINRELSASVPASMQALADPTGNASTSQDAQTSTTRKN